MAFSNGNVSQNIGWSTADFLKRMDVLNFWGNTFNKGGTCPPKLAILCVSQNGIASP
jgi:hypothetical protein